MRNIEVVKKVANRHNMTVRDLSLVQGNPEDLKGIPVVKKTEEIFSSVRFEKDFASIFGKV